MRSADSDADLIRLTCSLANELVDGLSRADGVANRRQAAVELATRRYARALGLGLREVLEALQPPLPDGSRPAVAGDDALPTARSDAPKPSALRNKLAPGNPAGPH